MRIYSVVFRVSDSGFRVQVLEIFLLFAPLSSAAYPAVTKHHCYTCTLNPSGMHIYTYVHVVHVHVVHVHLRVSSALAHPRSCTNSLTDTFYLPVSTLVCLSSRPSACLPACLPARVSVYRPVCLAPYHVCACVWGGARGPHGWRSSSEVGNVVALVPDV